MSHASTWPLIQTLLELCTNARAPCACASVHLIKKWAVLVCADVATNVLDRRAVKTTVNEAMITRRRKHGNEVANTRNINKKLKINERLSNWQFDRANCRSFKTSDCRTSDQTTTNTADPPAHHLVDH